MAILSGGAALGGVFGGLLGLRRGPLRIRSDHFFDCVYDGDPGKLIRAIQQDAITFKAQIQTAADFCNCATVRQIHAFTLRRHASSTVNRAGVQQVIAQARGQSSRQRALA